jgi:hypothetical protein
LPDWIITPNKHSARLRAATDSRKLNRVYTIRVVARDSVGNVTKGQTTVTVVADRKKPGRR